MTTRQVSIRVQTDGKAEVKRDFTEIGQSGVAAQQQLASATQNATAYSDRQIASFKKMAQAAKDAQSQAEQQAKFNAILGVNPGSGAGSAEASAAAFMQAPGGGAANLNLNRIQQQMLGSAAFRSFESLVSGASLGRVALQQGGEVADAFAQGDQGLGGSLSALTKLITPAAVALTALTVAVIAGGVAALLYTEDLKKLNLAAEGLGSTAGLSGNQLETLAETSAKAGDVSISAARGMAESYVNTGRLGGDVIARLIAVTRDYSVATGQDAKAATAELAKAFADPAKGADELNSKLHFLDDTTYQHIQTLMSQNRVTEAQNALMDALGPRVEAMTGKLGGLGEAAHKVAGFFMDMATWYGKLIAQFATSGPVSDQIQQLMAKRATLTPGMIATSSTAARDAANLDAQINTLVAGEIAKWKAASASTTNQIASDARDAMHQVDGLSQRLIELNSQRAKIVAGQTSGDLTAGDMKEAGADLKKVDADIAAVKAGYGSAAEQAAAWKRSQAEAAAAARKAAEEDKKFSDQIQRQMDIRAKNMLEIAKLSGDKQAIADAQEGLRIEQLTKDYQVAGLSATVAQGLAQKQMLSEQLASASAAFTQLQKQEDKIFDTSQRLKGMKPFDINMDALADFSKEGVSIFDKFATSLEAGKAGWKNWGDAAKSAILEVIDEFEKLAIINPIENALFGNVSGYQSKPSISGVGNFFTSLFGGSPSTNFTPGYAGGTDFAPGGWSTVGEQGPERMWVPRGAKIVPNSRSAGDQPLQVNIVLNAQGAGPREIDELKAQVADLKRTLPGTIVATINDSKSRGRV